MTTNELNWRQRAMCIGVDPDLFYRIDNPGKKEAKAVCDVCPVRRQCFDLAMEMERPRAGEGAKRNLDLSAGIYGGMTAAERWAIRFPEESKALRAREAEQKRTRYARMTPAERMKERGRNNGHAPKEENGLTAAA